MNPIRVIALDAFGTTIIRDNKLLDPYMGLFRDCGHEMTAAMKYKILTTRMDFKDTVREFLPRHERNSEALCKAAEKRLQEDFAQAHRAPGLDQLVIQARDNGIDLCIISNLGYRYGELVETLIPDIPHKIFSYDSGSLKPEKEIFLKAAQEMKCTPEDMIMVGDRHANDVLGPRHAGYRDAFWLHPYYLSLSQLQMEGDCGIRALGEVMLTLKRRGLVL